MMAPLSAILRQSDGRYLSAEEREAVLAYAHDLPAAVRAGEEILGLEAAMIAAIVGELRDQFPRFDRLFAGAWEQFAADLQMVLRADVRAMLSNDLRALEDKALFYLRSILAAYNVTPQFVREAFSRLRDHCRTRLGTETFARMAPFLERNIQVLADFPEPAVAMV